MEKTHVISEFQTKTKMGALEQRAEPFVAKPVSGSELPAAGQVALSRFLYKDTLMKHGHGKNGIQGLVRDTLEKQNKPTKNHNSTLE